ncbi:MAG: hypothetical protein Q7J42_12715 [Sulfuritalea sp.]|nr:hypothetical protein [Sulfuritalea sp.]
MHPGDRLVTIYTLNAESYSVPDVRELVGTLAVSVLPEIVIDWERVVRELDD